MKIVVLGAAAGGGFPQWNSNAAACRRARSGDPAARPRTQASVAVSGDGRRWFVFNAAPDLRQQIENTPCLHPREGLRSSPIAGVVLTNGDVDAVAGLLTLRERQPLGVYATSEIQRVLAANPIFDVLSRELVARRDVALDQSLELDGGDGLHVELFAVPGKVPLYLEGTQDPPPIVEGEGTVGAAIEHDGRRCYFIPGCAAMTPALAERLRDADLVFFDGTLWRDDEMIAAGLGPKSGRRMGHMSLTGDEGTLTAFAGLGVGRKILIHINNSNPVLLDDSPERAQAQAAGWEIAYDGMEVEL